MSAVLWRSPATRLEAKDEKATKRPLAEIAGNELSAFPWVPSELTLRSVVLPRFRSRKKTSTASFRSPWTRSEAGDSKATKRPLAEIEGMPL